ncbi:MAG: hypothetical protein JJE04_21115 [Acidobacteriia bacterium]|nr:hypothetical protein [Terriglobia bacterium]
MLKPRQILPAPGLRLVNNVSHTSLAVICALFLVLILGLTLPRFAWHVAFFRQAGPTHYNLLLALLPVLFAGPLAWHYGRRKLGIPIEPFLVLALVLAPAVIYQPRAFLVILLFAGSCHLIGHCLLAWLKVTLDSLALYLPITCAVGFSLMSLVLFLLGLAGLYTYVVFALLLIPVLPGWRVLRRTATAILASLRHWPHWEGQSNPVMGAVVFYLAAFLLLVSISAITPAINGDAIRFHLSLAKAYMQEGRLFAPPHIDYTYYPQGFEILLTMLWTLGGQAAAQFLNPLQFVLTLLLTAGIARQCGLSRFASLLGVTLALTAPFLHWTGSVVKNDFGMALFVLCALSLFIHWAGHRGHAVIFAGVFLVASAFSIKHVALLGAAPLALIAIRAWWNEPRRLAAGAGLLLLFTVMTIGWYARAWRASGNPLYPSEASHAVPATDLWFHKFHRAARLPWISHFEGRRSFESPTDNPMGVAVLVFAPLLVLLRLPGGAATRTAWFFIGIYLLYWGVVIGMIRYAIAPLLLLFVFIAGRIEAASSANRVLHLLVLAGFVYCAAFALPITVILEMLPTQPAMLAGRISREDLLRAELPPFGAMQFLSRQAQASDRILSLGNWAVCYAPFPAKVNHVYRNSRTYSPEDPQPLGKEPYDFLILPNGPELAGLERSAAAMRKLKSVYRDKQFVLYRLH